MRMICSKLRRFFLIVLFLLCRNSPPFKPDLNLGPKQSDIFTMVMSQTDHIWLVGKLESLSPMPSICRTQHQAPQVEGANLMASQTRLNSSPH